MVNNILPFEYSKHTYSVMRAKPTRAEYAHLVKFKIYCAMFRVAKRSLTDKMKEVYYLRHLTGMTYANIAKRLNISTHAVHSRLNHSNPIPAKELKAFHIKDKKHSRGGRNGIIALMRDGMARDADCRRLQAILDRLTDSLHPLSADEVVYLETKERPLKIEKAIADRIGIFELIGYENKFIIED